jgi:hypothetical protein
MRILLARKETVTFLNITVNLFLLHNNAKIKKQEISKERTLGSRMHRGQTN